MEKVRQHLAMAARDGREAGGHHLRATGAGFLQLGFGLCLPSCHVLLQYFDGLLKLHIHATGEIAWLRPEDVVGLGAV